MKTTCFFGLLSFACALMRRLGLHQYPVYRCCHDRCASSSSCVDSASTSIRSESLHCSICDWKGLEALHYLPSWRIATTQPWNSKILMILGARSCLSLDTADLVLI